MAVLRSVFVVLKSIRSEVWLALLYLGSSLGCFSGPISSEVAPGGTILLPLNSENSLGRSQPIGFGGTADMAAAGRFDECGLFDQAAEILLVQMPSRDRLDRAL